MKKPAANCIFYGLIISLLMCSLIAGSYLLISSVLSFQEAKESEHWHTTTGVIVNTWVEKYEDREDGYTTISYLPKWEYTYVVNGKTYSGQRVNFGTHRHYDSSDKAQKRLSTYPIGAEVDVYYDPAEPSKAVLVRELSGGTFLVGMGVLFIAFPFGFWFIVKKAKKRSPPAGYTKTTFS